MKAVVLLSGGIDSTVVLYGALEQGYDVTALSFDYGQRHAYELECAKRITAHRNVPHIVQALPLPHMKSPLLDREATKQGNMYVSGRNTLFLSYALALCESIRAPHIFIGANADDFSGYPDCRPEYIRAFQRVANLAGVHQGYEILAPLINLSKQDIVTKGRALGVDFTMTSSCYAPVDGVACGVCDACILRERALKCTQ